MSPSVLEAPVQSTPVGALDPNTRSQFLIRTYAHLYGAIMLLAGLEYGLFKSGVALDIMRFVFSTSWLLILGGFMVLSWMARSLARPDQPMPMQYAGLAAYIAGQALLFVPLLYLADYEAPGAISQAIYATVIGFTALTLLVTYTGKDFTFLRTALMWGGIVSLIAIVGACLFHFNLGAWFDVGMIALAGASILNDTSRVLRYYPTNGYVAASLQLFASVTLLFWYILRLLGGSRR